MNTAEFEHCVRTRPSLQTQFFGQSTSAGKRRRIAVQFVDKWERTAGPGRAKPEIRLRPERRKRKKKSQKLPHTCA